MKKLFFVLIAAFFYSMSAFAAVNLNTATKEELESLKGVGPAKAQAILDYRQKNGSFKTVDDLNNVPGFGDKTLAKLRSEISVSGKTTVAAPVAAPAKATPAAKVDKSKLTDKPAKEPKVVPAPAPAPTAAAPVAAPAKPEDSAKAAKKAAAEERKAAKAAKKAADAAAAPAAK
ncbi:MAG: topoisomerase [Methylophilaceae bacterium]|nr:topoisomerase [Methylophilaceae bacterium]